MSITRIGSGPRMSQIVIHGDTVYLAGQVGTEDADITTQARDALAQVDALLAQAGTDKSHALQVTVWLADMADFAAMNAVYDAWIDPANPPTRATGEAKLATPGYKVEFIVTAARQAASA
ncbi:MAG: RidA family protein [Paracoccus sp. (in: a-proteobacteria)]|nr:RidA family protein [Paracoccus sp. (in: a-proteobacteria)]